MNSQNVTDSIAEQQAYHAAESGIQTAVHVLRCQKNQNPGCADVVANPLINTSASPTDTPNQINYIKALDPVTSNKPADVSAPYRLTRWINYSSTCGPTAVPCVPLNQPGYSYSLQISDPDNVGRYVSVATTGKLYDNDDTAGTDPTKKREKTYNTNSSGVVTPNNWLKITYTPPSAIVDQDMSGGSLTTTYGTFTITRDPSNNGQIIPSNNRFDIVVRMSRPFNAVREIRGWILSTSSASEIPKIIFDSQSLTLVGSSIDLNLTNAPSAGWSSVQTVMPPATTIGYQGQASLGANVIGGTISPPEPVRLLIKSTGYGPRGAKKELQSIIQKNFFNGLTAPAALTLVGPRTTTNPNSTFQFSLGQSAVLQYSGIDQVSTDIIPPIGTSDPTNLSCVEDYIAHASPVDPACATAYPNGSNPFNGSVQGTASDVTDEMPYWLETPQALDAEIHQFASTARSSNRFFANGVTPTSWGDNVTGQGITFCDGDVTLGQQQGDGGGILVVTGTLTLKGSFNFKGLIIVTGPGGVLRQGGGLGEITGNVVVAPYVNDKIADILSPATDLPAGQWLAPTYNMDGGGTSNLQYNSQSLSNGLTAISNFVLGVMEK